MIEVEIKARTKNTNGIRKRLDRIGAKFIKKEKQTDRIFGHDRFLDANNMVIEKGLLARIRTAGKRVVLEFKEVARFGGGLEIKSDLNDINAGLELLRKLEFKEAFTVSKIREQYAYNDFSVCLDSVNGLGNFIEIEKMITTQEEKEKARKECLDLLGVLSPDLVVEERKYGDLMQEMINKKRAN